MTSLGCVIPSCNSAPPYIRRTTAVGLANIRDEAFHGTLELTPATGFAVSPQSVPVTLQPGARLSIPLEVTMADSVPVGKYALGLQLVTGEGRTELDRQTSIENLGRRGRMIGRRGRGQLCHASLP